MPRFTLIIAIVSLVIGSSLQARGAVAVLPPEAVAADSVAVIHVESAQLNPDTLAAAATALLGEDAKELDEPLKKFKEMYTKATAAGMDAITIIIGAPKKDDPDERKGTGVLYVRLKPDADVEAIKKLLLDKMLERGDHREIVFDQLDNWLAMHTKKQDFPVKADVAKEAVFAAALASMSTSALQVAFSPDKSIRDQMLKHAADSGDAPNDLRPLLARSVWLALAIDLGSAPKVTGGAKAANDADATDLSTGIKANFDDLKAEAARPGPVALVAPLIEKVIDGLKLTQTGTRVTVSANAESLKLVVDFADTMGAFNDR